MNRGLLVGLILLATTAFVIGVALERNAGDDHHAGASAATPAESGESAAEHAEEGAGGEGHSKDSAKNSTPGESDATVLGIDLESTPFVILAALGSLAFALAVWVRPRWAALLAVIAGGDGCVRCARCAGGLHQVDENREGLAVLAGVVAGLHLSIAVGAAVLGRRAEVVAS